MSVAIVRTVRARWLGSEWPDETQPPTSSPELAAKITNEVAWEKNGRTADGPYGLHVKPSGMNYQGVSIDRVAERPVSQLWDCLGDADGYAKPQWYADAGIAQWTPVRLDWLSGAPAPPPPQPPPGNPLEARVAALEGRVTAIEARLRQAGAILADS